MNTSYHISNYCTIHNHAVVLNGALKYAARQSAFTEFITGAYQHFEVGYPKFHKMDRLSKLGFLTAELLFHDANITQHYPGSEIGIMLMNASSSLDTDEVYQQSIDNRSDYFPSPAIFVYTLPNIVIGEICIRHKIFGEGTFFVKERFDPDFLCNYTRLLFEDNAIQCCLAGWVEARENNYKSVMYLIEKSESPNSGIANFEPSALQNIFAKKI